MLWLLIPLTVGIIVWTMQKYGWYYTLRRAHKKTAGAASTADEKKTDDSKKKGDGKSLLDKIPWGNLVILGVILTGTYWLFGAGSTMLYLTIIALLLFMALSLPGGKQALRWFSGLGAVALFLWMFSTDIAFQNKTRKWMDSLNCASWGISCSKAGKVDTSSNPKVTQTNNMQTIYIPACSDGWSETLTIPVGNGLDWSWTVKAQFRWNGGEWQNHVPFSSPDAEAFRFCAKESKHVGKDMPFTWR